MELNTVNNRITSNVPHASENECVYWVPAATKLPGRGTLAVKRALDLFLALVCSILLAVPMIAIGVVIVIDSKGAPIYLQERLGKGGDPFTIYKFRSMRIDAEANGPKWASENDARCTRFGRFLRKTHLDELPQLWNILKGDMSFVGPRPERGCFYNEFETYIHGFRNRLAVTPGLTGLAQVNGGYDLPPEKKIIWDMKYIKEQSLLLDFKIILKTLLCVFKRTGAR